MKIEGILLLIGIAVLICGCTTQIPETTATSVPSTVPTAMPTLSARTNAIDLTGIWIGTNVRYVDPSEFRENISISYNITKQSGSTFMGVKELTKQSDGKTYAKNFTGVITANGRVYISDEDQGYNIARISDNKRLEVVHLVDGSADYSRTWVGTFRRPSALNEATVPVQIPDITGTWTGNNVSYLRPGTYYDNLTIRLTITTQKGPVFKGEKEIFKPEYEKTFLKNFTGVISSTGEVYITDEGQGYNIGKFTTPDSLEIVHLADGSVDYPRLFLGTFNRPSAASPTDPVGTPRNITGTWVVKNASIYVNPSGYFDNLSIKFTITVQNGTTFEGFKEVVKPSDGKTYKKKFTGVVSSSGEVFITDEGKGYNIGRFIDEDSVEIIHLADGSDMYPKTWIGLLARHNN
jgi:acyl-CoA thioesterase FadM